MATDLNTRLIGGMALIGALVQIVLNATSTGLTWLVQGGPAATTFDPGSTTATLGLLATVLLCLGSLAVYLAVGAGYAFATRKTTRTVSIGLLGGALSGGLAGLVSGLISGCLSLFMLPLVLGALAETSADALLFGGMAAGGLLGILVGVVGTAGIGLTLGTALGGIGGGATFLAVNAK